MDYWKKTKIKRNYETHYNCGDYCRSLYWNYSWDKEVL